MLCFVLFSNLSTKVCFALIFLLFISVIYSMHTCQIPVTFWYGVTARSGISPCDRESRRKDRHKAKNNKINLAKHLIDNIKRAEMKQRGQGRHL